VEPEICRLLAQVIGRAGELGIEAIVLARGGGSREDLAVFDGEGLARLLAASPVPVVTGLGHEDDTTVADLVADYRAATPTAALVALLPDRQSAQLALGQSRRHLREVLRLRLQSLQDGLRRQREQIDRLHPSLGIAQQRAWLGQQRRRLEALAPHHLLQRGFAVVRKDSGTVLRSVKGLEPGELLRIALADGELTARVDAISPSAARSEGASPKYRLHRLGVGTVENRYLVPSGGEVPGHRKAHHAKANKGDFHLQSLLKRGPAAPAAIRS
jgi:exodeoxyribonuclease VII large subunit